jgi:hypothetical protein
MDRFPFEVTAMTEFQKIAIGLLGLTHPEMFIPRPRADQKPTAKIEPADGQSSARPVRRREGQFARTARAIRFVLAALAIGSRTVALADNTQLRRDLGACAGLLYGSGED